ncbi:hypothetical protein PLICRDRAFT_180165 [Plicaturopsis crispa FD-325 SS-3]|uniref:DUF6534 domain-containing protein n=1 Tax=Plicaturopsis crispa FD-325 SS-3 TaxID=944288 RepID=A0A0C9SKJ2_PLICR|nr:hypothetical protein PLICRDRAFT_180165 [Plicaturopsis crispa FD-325 SS-3]
MTQAFFARRIWVISGRLPIATVCWALCLLYLATIIRATVVSFSCSGWIDCTTGGKSIIVTLLSTGAFTDLLIAASLCYYLLRERSNAITPTIAMLDKLLVWTIQTGLLTRHFLAAPRGFTWLGIFMFLPRLFSMSLLGSLNARTSIRRDLHATVMSSVHVHVTKNLDSVDDFEYRADVAAGKDVSAELCPSEEKAVTPKTVRILGDSTTPSG